MCQKKSANKGKYKYSIDYIINRLKEKNILLLDEYKDMYLQNSFQCLKCGYIFKTKLANIINNDTKCIKCVHNSFKLSNEEFATRVNKLLPEIQLLDEYNNYHGRINYSCTKCGTKHSALASNLLRGYGCPVCSSSKGEKRCKKYFETIISYLSLNIRLKIY